jgi:hypothetical protein
VSPPLVVVCCRRRLWRQPWKKARECRPVCSYRPESPRWGVNEGMLKLWISGGRGCASSGRGATTTKNGHFYFTRPPPPLSSLPSSPLHIDVVRTPTTPSPSVLMRASGKRVKVEMGTLDGRGDNTKPWFGHVHSSCGLAKKHVIWVEGSWPKSKRSIEKRCVKLDTSSAAKAFEPRSRGKASEADKNRIKKKTGNGGSRHGAEVGEG